MTTDLVERLRAPLPRKWVAEDGGDGKLRDPLRLEAADALEAKDAEIERLRKRVDEVDRLPELEWTQASAAIVAEFHKTMRSGDQSAAQKMIAALDLGKVYVTRLRERAERAEAERDALRQDAERLDYLDERRDHTQFPEIGRRNIVVIQCGEGQTLRAAIDAAKEGK